MHNILFPDTAYSFYGFAGFDGRTVQPVIVQPRIADAHPATKIMIDTYMAALGFEKTTEVGRFRNGQCERGTVPCSYSFFAFRRCPVLPSEYKKTAPTGQNITDRTFKGKFG